MFPSCEYVSFLLRGFLGADRYLEASSCWPDELLANDHIVEVVKLPTIHDIAAQDLSVVEVFSRTQAHGKDVSLCHLVDQLLRDKRSSRSEEHKSADNYGVLVTLLTLTRHLLSHVPPE
jgi:hypothetical protein